MESVLVTGASSGIGFAAAERFLEKGFRVYCGARRTERMAALAEKGATVLCLDITREESLAQAAERIAKECGSLDILVNSAGFGRFGAIEEISVEEMRRQFEVNVFGMAQTIRHLLPLLKKGKGRIINISSAGGRIHTPLGGLYHSSKYAVEGLSDCLRFELKQFGLRVVLIEPGAVDSAWFDLMQAELRKNYEESGYKRQIDSYCRLVGMGRKFFSKPSKIAKTVYRAANARHPRTRYAIGFMAKPAILARRLLPAGAYDGMLRLFFH